MPDLDSFFRAYAEAFNRALTDTPDLDSIRSVYTDCFLAAGPAGVSCGHNDDGFAATLDKGYAFYRSIGTRRMSVRGVAVTPIDERHHLAKVFFTADYEKKDGEALSIDFDVAYLTQTRDGVTKICAFVAGDETALYREKGLI
ncbi:nuclear transport factor 2 family protein [Caulobacter sp. 17J65-9]|uniref:nuclear transport factor 2 family protein n=1 Tax=Caulobacter sp. 17J65-9 TaxID=2709382 RepID=UPI0013CC5548|nr:nuclear transport factor 2 family protein [Caulobacter sp. 17J65-9]NEX94288.1 nuclear transport factor 2 family protein [Caulobacter sp. 17J65-9]